MLDERVRAVLARLEAGDARNDPAAGRFLYAYVTPQTACEVLETGDAYLSLWLAAGVRLFGGRVLSLVADAAACDAWLANVEEAGLAEWAQLAEGDPFESLERIEDVFDVVVLAGDPAGHERLYAATRPLLEPGGAVIAAAAGAGYSAARQADPDLESLTVPLGGGVELSVVLR
jgi:predicted O-methyltransferase YrrM